VEPCTEGGYNGIIRTVLAKYDVEVYTGFIWRRIGGAIDGVHL
jgi:hypothetical protein